jgi:hypothetical protein
MINNIAGTERSPRIELGFLDGIRGLCTRSMSRPITPIF